ncbi:MAG: PepSY domain-containing protein [Methylobacteriaceae bacterium]|nr:PepSY domain-containing protein [Methylobacteriaceae bacterium]
MSRALALAGLVLASMTACVVAAPAQTSPPPRRQCLSATETLDVIAANRLAGPSETLGKAAGAARAEPLGARLCRWNEDFVYEITLLRADGRVLRVFVDAASGKVVGSPSEN